MPKLYFHVRQCDTRFEATSGIEFRELGDAWQHAHSDALAIAQNGMLRLNLDEQWMEIADETGAIVATLPFSRAVTKH